MDNLKSNVPGLTTILFPLDIKIRLFRSFTYKFTSNKHIKPKVYYTRSLAQ